MPLARDQAFHQLQMPRPPADEIGLPDGMNGFRTEPRWTILPEPDKGEPTSGM